MRRFAILAVLLVAGCASTTAREADYDAASKPDQGSSEIAVFGVDGRNEDYLRGCFPCCFCCEGPGTCCSQCRDRNQTLAIAPQSPR